LAFALPKLHREGSSNFRAKTVGSRSKVIFINSNSQGLRPVHTTPGEFKNGDFTLKVHQMFSAHITPEEFKNATVTGHFEFVFEENSAR